MECLDEIYCEIDKTISELEPVVVSISQKSEQITESNVSHKRLSRTVLSAYKNIIKRFNEKKDEWAVIASLGLCNYIDIAKRKSISIPKTTEDYDMYIIAKEYVLAFYEGLKYVKSSVIGK